MRGTPDMPGERLVELSRSLLTGVESLVTFERPVLVHSDDAARIRSDIVLALRTKVLPELGGGDFPVFVGVQGGTNVGKSTVFNALAGHILSPAVVQGSATKHPLVFAHESWRKRLLESETFSRLDRRELRDPKELLVDEDATDLLYFRFHEDDSLAHLALIDSPDFDSALESNVTVARWVTALSDVTIWVTTAQKYKDRVLVDHLKLLIELKACVLLVFNLLDEDIVFRTLLDDLRGVVRLPKEDVIALRVPRCPGAHPEDEVRRHLAEPVLARLTPKSDPDLKPRLVRRTLRKTLENVDALTAIFQREVELEQRISKLLETQTAEAVHGYEGDFQLALPEETAAVRRVLATTELWNYLALDEKVESSSTVLKSIGTALARGTDVVRRLLLRFVGSDQGATEQTARALEEYRRSRDEADLQQVSRRALLLRQEIESTMRDAELASPLAREVLGSFFGPEPARAFSSEVEEAHRRETDARRDAGEKILERTDAWLKESVLGRRAVAVGGIALKLTLGSLAAWLLPPDAWFSLFTIAEFAAGYLLGAYLLAALVSWRLRSRGKFREARVDGLRATLEATIGGPLREAMGRILDQDAVRSIRQTSRRIGEQLEETSARPALPPAPADD